LKYKLQELIPLTEGALVSKFTKEYIVLEVTGEEEQKDTAVLSSVP
jgi:hypothetical protein